MKLFRLSSDALKRAGKAFGKLDDIMHVQGSFANAGVAERLGGFVGSTTSAIANSLSAAPLAVLDLAGAAVYGLGKGIGAVGKGTGRFIRGVGKGSGISDIPSDIRAKRRAIKSANMSKKATDEAINNANMQRKRLEAANDVLSNGSGFHSQQAIDDARKLNTLNFNNNQNIQGPKLSQAELQSISREVNSTLSPDFIGPMPLPEEVAKEIAETEAAERAGFNLGEFMTNHPVIGTGALVGGGFLLSELLDDDE